MDNWFKYKKVLITGHTGFKGAWLCKMLLMLGAEVTGYALEAPKGSLFSLCQFENCMDSVIGDVRDFGKINNVIKDKKPEIVIHLAAQPIVRASYENPHYTYETNVMGTVNLCESIRKSESVKSFLNITTDKVYYNHEWPWGYRENDALDGYDPYSNSKSCSEMVSHSYERAFFSDLQIAASTVRAGNVIGGGDFANDRIIPDCYRAVIAQQKILVRNAYSIRPYQHVLEALCAYLMIVQKQSSDISFSGSYNVGPNDEGCITTGELVSLFCEYWGENAQWEQAVNGGPHEANFLKLDCSKIKTAFQWKPKWNIEKAVQKTVEWYNIYRCNEDINKNMEEQIKNYIEER